MKYVIFISLFFSIFSMFSQGSNYRYDKMGRMIGDRSEGIQEIRWNNMNKITHVIRSDTSTQPDLRFIYDPLGNRIAKWIMPRDGNGMLPELEWIKIYYLYTDKSELLATYESRFSEDATSSYTENWVQKEQILKENNRIGYKRLEIHQASYLFSAAINNEGEFVNIADESLLIAPVSENPHDNHRALNSYELTNHSNDVTTVISDRKNFDLANPSSSKAEVRSASNYYPYGMALPDRVWEPTSYRYGFSGMEKDNEIKGAGNSYDFGARIYDSRLGRWLSIDPLYASDPSKSPYHYAHDSPIAFNDPDGNNGKFTVIPDKNGIGGRIIISTDIAVEQMGQNKAFTSNFQRIIDQYYKPGTYVDPTTGEHWRIEFDINVYNAHELLLKVGPEEFRSRLTNLDISLVFVYNLGKDRNFIKPLDQDDTRSDARRIYLKDSNLWDLYYYKFGMNEDIYTLLHEVVHQLGVSDRYVEPNESGTPDQHTRETKREDEEGRTIGEVAGRDPEPNIPFRIDQVHFDNWAKYALSQKPHPGVRTRYYSYYRYGEGVKFYIKTDQPLDIKNGKLTSPYVNLEYERNKRAYWSARRSELAQKRTK